LEGAELVFPEEIRKDASQCIPDELISLERFLEEVFSSNSEIAVHIEDDRMRWEAGETTLHLARADRQVLVLRCSRPTVLR
jgi:hypothetical protein